MMLRVRFERKNLRMMTALIPCLILVCLLAFFMVNDAIAETSSFDSYMKATISALKKGGLVGMQRLSMDCYDKLNKKPSMEQLERCGCIDFAGFFIDDATANHMGWTVRDHYFSIPEFHNRIGPFFIKNNISMESANKLIYVWEKEMSVRVK